MRHGDVWECEHGVDAGPCPWGCRQEALPHPCDDCDHQGDTCCGVHEERTPHGEGCLCASCRTAKWNAEREPKPITEKCVAVNGRCMCACICDEDCHQACPVHGEGTPMADTTSIPDQHGWDEMHRRQAERVANKTTTSTPPLPETQGEWCWHIARAIESERARIERIIDDFLDDDGRKPYDGIARGWKVRLLRLIDGVDDA